MERLLMLDSGAFSVWSMGASIDFEAYLDFCKSHPGVSYYVNLDVIPGEPGNKLSLVAPAGWKDQPLRTGDGRKTFHCEKFDLGSAEDIIPSTGPTPSGPALEEACAKGWANYLRMVRVLPPEKVIPVFHQNDPVSWLKKYLAHGVPYLGISPANDRTTGEKRIWMNTLQPFLFRKDGTPKVKIHGFAVTSFGLMKYWQWHSVDSASWKVVAGWGGIYVPREWGKGNFDYTVSPQVVSVSPVSPKREKRIAHFATLTPWLEDRTKRYLDRIGIPMGRTEIATVKEGHRLKVGKEYWYDQEARKVLRVLERGVAANWEIRAQANAHFIKELQLQGTLPVEHIYFAGAPKRQIEGFLGKRLLTFHDISRAGENTNVRKIFVDHLKKVEGGVSW